jgi:hypothetical protein
MLSTLFSGTSHVPAWPLLHIFTNLSSSSRLPDQSCLGSLRSDAICYCLPCLILNTSYTIGQPPPSPYRLQTAIQAICLYCASYLTCRPMIIWLLRTVAALLASLPQQAIQRLTWPKRPSKAADHSAGLPVTQRSTTLWHSTPNEGEALLLKNSNEE